MTLYEIDEQIRDIIAMSIDPETGEITDCTEELESLQMDQTAKRESIALLIKNMSAEAAAIRNEEKALAERRKSDENRVEWLKNYLMSSLAGEKFSTPKVSVGYRKSTGVLIEDEVAFLHDHPEYARIKTEIDKAAVKDELKKGAEISGAVLEERLNMTIK